MSYLKLDNITKKFGDFKALDSVDMSIESESIHALLGENGAGKTTLMNIIYGLYQPDGGSIHFKDNEVKIASPREAINLGIGMIHQHFMLVDTLTVTENIILGLEGLGRSLDIKKHEEKVAAIGEEFDFEIDPRAEIWKLPMGMRQRVEILKTLYRNADLLILDEPTSILAPSEIESFLKGLDRLRTGGKTILFITHKLEEVMAVGDDITVMRNGKITGASKVTETSVTEIARMMVGRDIVLDVNRPQAETGETALSVRNVSATDERGLTALSDISFDLRQGEILGIAGVDGNGQSELAEVITGMRSLDAGSVIVNDTDISNMSVDERRHEMKMSYVPADRLGTGLILDFSVANNCVLRDYNLAPYSKKTVIQNKVIKETSRDWVKKYDVRLHSVDQQVRYLSGGNQQKLVIAREVEFDPDIIIVMQPCKGLDIGAIDAVQKTIVEQKKAGKAILYISTELEHILAICDRIGVMCQGEITGIITPEQASPELIGKLMAGIKETEVMAC